MKPLPSVEKSDQAGASTPANTKPPHPYVVGLVSIFLPGMGQVLNGTPGRGLLMLFFMLMLGIITFHLTTPDQSFLGRYAGGLFIYSISVLDAYQWARYRWEYYRRYTVLKQPNEGTSSE